MAKSKAPARKAQPVRPKRSLTTAWAAAILALLVIAFFHEVIVGGKTFVSPDAVAPAGFVRVGEQSLYRDHVYPLWNPHVFLGMPSFASGAYNPLIYPPDWPLALVGKVLPLPSLTWLLLYYFLAGLFMFLLCREWGARPEGALLGAVAFVFAPNLVAVGTHGHGSQLVNSAYIPLLLWLTARWVRRGGVHHLGWLALAGGFQMLRGHVQIVFYTWLAVALYLVVDLVAALVRPSSATVPLRLKLVRALGIGAAVVLSFGLAGFYNLPLREYARFSIRGGGADGGVGMDYATQWSLAPWELITVAVPGAVGFGGQTYWGTMPFTDYPNAFLGMVALMLALPAFLTNGAPRIFALVLATLALLISFGKHFPLYGFLYQHLPLFNKFRVPVMAIVLFQAAAALGVAWGWSEAIRERQTKPARDGRIGKLMIAAGVILGLGLVVGGMAQGAWRQAYVEFATRQRAGFEEAAALAAQSVFVSDLVRSCLLGLLTVAAMFLVWRGKIPVALGTSVALLVILVELWPVSGHVMRPTLGQPIEASLDAGRDDVIEFLEKQGPSGSFRILPLAEFQTNRFAGFGISSVGGYHAAKTRLFQDFRDAEMVDKLGWVRLLNVRYIVAPVALPSPPPYFRPVFQGQGGAVYEFPYALPRATLVGEYRVVQNSRAILDSVGSRGLESGTPVYLERDPKLRLGSIEGGKATIVSYGLNDVVIETESPGPAMLRLADLWFPDWVATVEGRPVEVLKADALLRAVPVPAGKHRVEFHYRPRAIRDGLTISIISLVVILALLMWGWLASRRAAEPRPAGVSRENAGEAA